MLKMTKVNKLQHSEEVFLWNISVSIRDKVVTTQTTMFGMNLLDELLIILKYLEKSLRAYLMISYLISSKSNHSKRNMLILPGGLVYHNKLKGMLLFSHCNLCQKKTWPLNLPRNNILHLIILLHENWLFLFLNFCYWTLIYFKTIKLKISLFLKN